MPMAKELGILDEARRAFFDANKRCWNAWTLALRSVNVSPSEAASHGLPVSQDGQRRDGFQLLAFPDIGIDDLAIPVPGLDDVSEDALEQLEIEALYATYVERQERDAQALARDEAQAIPDTLDYDDLTGLSAELRGKLRAFVPARWRRPAGSTE
jgi:tRNA uridine 5-carboxymethylaminomethyl modification enzyme